MPVHTVFSKSSLNTESLWSELSDPHFDVDEYLESYIKQSLAVATAKQLKSIAAKGGQNLLTLEDSEASFTDVRCITDCIYDPHLILRCLNDLFDACVFVNSKAAYQHRQAEVALNHIEDEATDQLHLRAETVSNNLEEVEKLEEELRGLTTKLNTVSDRIFSITQPQERLKEAHKLLSYFIELNDDNLDLFSLTYPEIFQQRNTLEDYQKAAATILSLSKISKTVAAHKDEVFVRTRERIETLYNEIEETFVILFARGHEQRPNMDVNLMQQTAAVLQNFPVGYSQCIAGFVDRASKAIPNVSHDPYRQVIHICDATYKLIYEVFPGPDSIMEKFITQVMNAELEPSVHAVLRNVPDTLAGQEAYLHHLFDLYKRTKELEGPLSKFKAFRINSTIRHLFGSDLERYAQNECLFFRVRCTALMQQYYDVLAVEFNIMKFGIVQVLPETKDFFSPNLSKTIPVIVGDYLSGQPQMAYHTKVISESLALNVLHELRQSATRATSLLPNDDLGPCLLQLGRITITMILLIHVDYGMVIGMRALPSSDPKTEPNLTFLRLLQLANIVQELLLFQTRDCLKKLKRFKDELCQLREMMQSAKERCEKKASAGLEQCLNSAMNWIKNIFLQQQKTEYTDPTADHSVTPTAKKVIRFFGKLIHVVGQSVDGRNRQTIAFELGLRFHREILDHIDDFQYNIEEAMVLIGDIKGFRESVFLLKIDAITQLFDEMTLLSNLLIASGHNLPQMCKEVMYDVQALDSIGIFVRLREDFRSIQDSVDQYL